MTGLPPLPAERLAEPTPADIADRLASDARSLRKRIEGHCHPVEDHLELELSLLRTAIGELLD